MAKTTYLENIFLNLALRATAFTAPTTVYVALYTSTPGVGGGGTEVSGGAYARQSTAYGAASSGQVQNNAAVVFPQATANWGTITSFAILDASTGGNMLYFGSLTTSKTINTGDQLQFATGGITVTES
jgi:hypothetical protein